MKSAVIVFPGSNCDRDAKDALEKIGSSVKMVWHNDAVLDDDLDLIMVPGGFSYGDYLRSGAMASISPIMNEVVRLSKKGVKVLGVCNGFQILTETGLLDGVLLRNQKIKFICRDVFIKTENKDTVFTNKCKASQVLRIPIAHMDGNYFATADVLKKLEDSNNIAFRYVDENGNATDEANVNGSALNIAGIFNDQKNVLGMMPHPERALDAGFSSGDGMLIFKSLLG